jgi:hypothetical protein
MPGIDPELRRRQRDGEVGLFRFDTPPGHSWRRAIRVPLVVVLAGLLLAVVGPLPGLGVVLVLGGVSAAVIAILLPWVGL